MTSIKSKTVKLYNTPIEIGLRSLIVLSVTKDNQLDIERLMYFDHLSLHTFDIGGPESLHAPIPNRGVQLYSKRELIKKGVNILLSKELINLVSTEEGFTYRISEAGKEFLKFFQTKYFFDLVERAAWVAKKFDSYSNKKLKEYIDANIQNWGTEFVTTNISDNI